MRSSYDRQSQINSLYDQLTGKEVITSYTHDDYQEGGYLKALQFIADSNGKLSLETILTFDQKGTKIQRTILQYLARMSRGHFALEEYLPLLKKCDLNSSSNDEPPIAWSLAVSSTGRYHGNPVFLFTRGLITHCNLDATGPDGTTVAYVLADNKESRGYLKAASKTLKYNLNAASETGMTVACLLTQSEKEGRGEYHGDYNLDGKFLTSRPELLMQCDLEANPQKYLESDRTLAWRLAATPEGRAYFNRYPRELARCNLNTGYKGAEPGGSLRDADPKIWQLLLCKGFDDPELPDLVYAILLYRGMAKYELPMYSPQTKILSRYIKAFQYAASGNFSDLANLLKEAPRLLHTRTRDEGNNLLHVVLGMLDNLTSNTALITLISLHEDLFTQLDSLRKAPNRNGIVPSEYIKNKLLKNIFGKSISSLDAALDYSLDREHLDLFSDIITGKYRLTEDTDLQPTLKLLASLPEKFPKLLGFETITKIKLLSELIESKKNRFNGLRKFIPGHDLRLQKNLATKEKEEFKYFAANLIAIMQYCKANDLNLEKFHYSIPDAPKNLTLAIYSDEDNSQEKTPEEYYGNFKLIAQHDLTKLEKMLIDSPGRLNEEKSGTDDDTLLHVFLRELDTLDDSAINRLIIKYPKLVAQLTPLKASENKLGAIAADFIDNPVLKKLFGLYKSDVELLIDSLLDKTHYNLVRDILAGLYNLQGKQFQVESSGSISADKLIEQLEHAFEIIASYYDIYPDLLTAGTAAKINILLKEATSIKTKVDKAKKIMPESALQPTKYLSEEEMVLLQDFANNFIDIAGRCTLSIHRSAEALRDLPASAAKLSLQNMFAKPLTDMVVSYPSASASERTRPD